jgi:hypothetical protein
MEGAIQQGISDSFCSRRQPPYSNRTGTCAAQQSATVSKRTPHDNAVAVRAIGNCVVNWAKTNFPVFKTISAQGWNPPPSARIGVQIETRESERKLIHISVLTSLAARSSDGKEPSDRCQVMRGRYTAVHEPGIRRPGRAGSARRECRPVILRGQSDAHRCVRDSWVHSRRGS